MTDRELLELAAKAAGITDYVVAKHIDALLIDMGFSVRGYSERYWNPITCDDQALQLAVKLGLRVGTDGVEHKPAIQCWKPHYKWPDVWEPIRDDPYAATRRAIVRAAAEIGKGMK